MMPNFGPVQLGHGIKRGAATIIEKLSWKVEKKGPYSSWRGKNGGTSRGI